MRALGIGLLAYVVWLTLLGISLPETAEPACYDFNCADNRPCANSDGCLGPCECDLNTNSCVPQGG